MEEIILSRKKLNVISVILPLLMMILFTFIMIITKPVLYLEITWSLLIYVVMIFLIHEVLHGLGFKVIGKAEWINIKLTFNKKNFAPYCVCKDLILSKGQYIWIMLFPNIILSLLTLVILIKTNNIFWAIVMGYVVGCGTGDYYMVSLAMKYDKKIKFKNHPSEMGFFTYQ